MKKLLLFLLLAVSFAVSAQSTYYISKPLQLNTVPLSETKADSVLVYSAGEIVRLVPRSEFGGGSTPTLQQVTTSGATTTDKIILDNSSKGNMGEINGAGLKFDKGSGQIATVDASKVEVVTTDGGSLLTAGGVYTANNTLGLSTSILSGEIQISKSERGHIDLKADTTGVDVGNYDAFLQRKSGTIALLSDIPEAGISDAPTNGFSYARKNGNWTMFNEAPSFGQILDNTPDASVTGKYFILNSNSGHSTYFGANTITGLGATGSGKNYSITPDGLRLTENVDTWTYYENQKIEVSTPTATKEFLFPDKPTGTYTLATLDDITGGGSQDLQKVLENGTDAVIGMNQASILSDTGDGDGTRYFTFSTAKFDPNIISTDLQISTNLTRMLFQTDVKASGILLNNQGMELFQSGNSFANRTSVKFAEPQNSNTVLKFPAKALAGEYTLATLDDISLQHMVDTNQGFANNSAGSEFFFMLGNSNQFTITNGTNSTNNFVSQITQTMGHTRLRSEYGVGSTKNANVVDLVNDNILLQVGRNNNGQVTSVSFDEPTTTGYGQINVPSVPYDYPKRVFKFSVVQVFNNSTTTALSNANLNSTYPYAIVGDRIHCTAIAGAPTIYEKTSTGWVAQAVTVVP